MARPVDIVVLGAPGAGKGTQAKRIVAETGIAHIGTGDILRAAIEEGKPLGRKVKAVYDRGELVSDALMISVMRARLLLEDTASGALLDGFPRTLEQAEALDGLLEELDRELAIVIDLALPETDAVRRLLTRSHAEGRRDDTPDVIRHRLDVYHHETEPLIGYYESKGVLARVNAEGGEDEVFARVRKALETTPLYEHEVLSHTTSGGR